MGGKPSGKRSARQKAKREKSMNELYQQMQQRKLEESGGEVQLGKPVAPPPAEKKAVKRVAKKPAPVGKTPRKAPEKKPPQPSVHDPKRSKRITKEFNKAVVRSRTTSTRRRRNRGGNYILYILLFLVIAAILLIILANTVLFNCSAIEVEGNNKYTAEQIIAKSGLETGLNLLHIDENAAEQQIVNSLDYIDMAEISKVFPTRIKITVSEAVKYFCISQDGKTVTVSRGGKIIEQSAASNLPIVKGYEAVSLENGTMLSSAIAGKQDLPALLLSQAEEAGLKNITSIDITDRFDIEMVVDGRITLRIGQTTELDSKLIIAVNLITRELGENDNVTVNLNSTEKVYVRDNNITDVVPITPEDTSESADTSDLSESTESAAA